MNDAQIIAAIIQREGGWVNHPADRGGPTKYGITLDTLSRARGRKCSLDDVADLTEAEAATIYAKLYILGPGLDAIDDEDVRALIVDFAVHSGPGTAIKAMQRALGVYPDGVIGEKTKAALDAHEPLSLFLGVVANRARLFGQIIAERPSQSIFAKGWMNRLAEFIEAAAVKAA